MRARQQGVALLSALILMLVVVTTLTTVFYRHQLDMGQRMHSLHGDQARLLVLSVEEWASQVLSSRMDDRSVDSLEEYWARPVPPMPVEGGVVSGCLIDMQSRPNINSFADYDRESWQREMEDEAVQGLASVWLSLLAQLELPARETHAASIIDWVDENGQTIAQSGAEQGYYDSQRRAVLVLNGAVTDVSELAIMRGYDADMVRALDDVVSALPTTTSININTAEARVLRALAGESGQAFVDYVRNTRPFSGMQRFREGAGDVLGLSPGQAQRRWPDELVGVSSDYFVLLMRIELGSATLDARSLLSRANREEAVVVRRSMQTVPNVDRSALAPEQLALLESECRSRTQSGMNNERSS